MDSGAACLRKWVILDCERDSVETVDGELKDRNVVLVCVAAMRLDGL